MTEWLLGCIAFLTLLAVLAALADGWDARAARREARRRNPRSHVR